MTITDFLLRKVLHRQMDEHEFKGRGGFGEGVELESHSGPGVSSRLVCTGLGTSPRRHHGVGVESGM